MGSNNSTVRPHGEGHPPLYRKGVEAVEEGRYSVAELYFQQALKEHPGRAFWSELGGLLFGTRSTRLQKLKEEEEGEGGEDRSVSLEKSMGGGGMSYLWAQPETSLSLSISKNFYSNKNHKFLDVPLDHRLGDILDYIRMATDIMHCYLSRNRADPKNMNIALVYCGFISSQVQMFFYLYAIWLEVDSEETFSTLRKAHERFEKEKEARGISRRSKKQPKAGGQLQFIDSDDEENDSDSSSSSSTEEEGEGDQNEAAFQPLSPSRQAKEYHSPEMQPLSVMKQRTTAAAAAQREKDSSVRVVIEDDQEEMDERDSYFFRRRGGERHAVIAHEVPSPKKGAMCSMVSLDSGAKLRSLSSKDTEDGIRVDQNDTVPHTVSERSSSSTASLAEMEEMPNRNRRTMQWQRKLSDSQARQSAAGRKPSLSDSLNCMVEQQGSANYPSITQQKERSPKNLHQKREVFLKSIRVNNDSITEEDLKRTLSLMSAYLRYYWMVSCINYCALSILYLKELGVYGTKNTEAATALVKMEDPQRNTEKMTVKKANKVLQNLLQIAGRVQYDMVKLASRSIYQEVKGCQQFLKSVPAVEYFLFPEEEEENASTLLTSKNIPTDTQSVTRSRLNGEGSLHSGSKGKEGSHKSKQVQSFFANVTGNSQVSQQTFLYMAKDYNPTMPFILNFDTTVEVHFRFLIYEEKSEKDEDAIYTNTADDPDEKRKKKAANNNSITVTVGNSSSQLQDGSNVLSGEGRMVVDAMDYNHQNNQYQYKRTLLPKKSLAKITTPAQRNTLFYTSWFSSRNLRLVPGYSHHLLKNMLPHYYNNYLFYNNKNFQPPHTSLLITEKAVTCNFGTLLLSEGALQKYMEEMEKNGKHKKKRNHSGPRHSNPAASPVSSAHPSEGTTSVASRDAITKDIAEKRIFTASAEPNKNLFLSDLVTIQALELEEAFLQQMLLVVIHAKVLSDTQCAEQGRKYVKCVRKTMEGFYGGKSPEFQYFEQVLSIYV